MDHSAKKVIEKIEFAICGLVNNCVGVLASEQTFCVCKCGDMDGSAKCTDRLMSQFRKIVYVVNHQVWSIL